MKLRPYQAKAAKAARALLDRRKRVVIVAPTGSGKTVIGAAIIRETPGRVLWLAHRIELLRQARARLLEAGLRASEVGIVSGVETENPDARVVVGSVDSVRRRDLRRDVALVVVDEAHRVEANGYQAILAENPKAAVLGLTATPWRLDGRGLGGTFAEMVVAAQSVELIADGFLASPVTYAIPRDRARDIVSGISSTAGDYAQGALGRALMRPKLMGDVVAECRRRAPKAKTIVFAASRDHGRALLRGFIADKRRAAYVDGETPADERAEMVRSFGEPRGLDVLINVEVLAEGFDLPAVKCIVLARPTKSLTRYLQHVGRASRPFGDARAVILDHAGNVYRHGLAQSNREWSLADREGKGAGEAPVKECDECEALIPAGAKVCPECGAEQARDAKEVEAERVDLERVAMEEAERKRVRSVLESIAKARGFAPEWVERAAAQVSG